MYKRRVKGRQTEYQNSIKKFLEQSKDPLKRLKSLKHGLEKSSAEEIKEFYLEYSSIIFFVVYSSFTAVETAIQERVDRGKGYNDLHLKDLLEVVLPALSRILVTLPELIKKRWQFNSICLIIRKLLHPENNVKLKQYGIKLLTLWVQGLQENAGDACMEIFASAVPHFPPRKTPMGLPAPANSAHSPAGATPSSSSSLSERYGTYSSRTSLGRQDRATPLLKNSSNVLSGASQSRVDVICLNIIYPLSLAPAIDDSDLTLELMDYLLRCLTSTVDRLHWSDPSQYLRGFSFLFFLFKLFYLACLYKDFRTEAGLYTLTPPPDVELPSTSKTSEQQLQSVQEEPLGTPISAAPRPTTTSNSALYKRKRTQNPYRLSSVIKLDYDLSHPVYKKVKNLVLKYVLMWVLPRNQQGRSSEPRIPGSPAPSPISLHQKFMISGVELMRDMWFTSRDNVSLLLEVCRQGFDTPLSETIKLKKLIDLYFYWQQATQKPPELQPPFMLSPPVQSSGETTVQLTTGVSVREGSDPTAQYPGTELALLHSPVVLSWEQLSGYEGFKALPVQAGLQATLKMIIAHTSLVFLKEASDKEELKSQCELCGKIIRLYQDITVPWSMDHDTWEYMLAVLLHMTQELLKGGPPSELESTLGGNLAGSLLKTLLVCYLRASMTIKVSSRLWDNLLLVLSSLTQWKEVVVQWKQVMDSMMHILGQSVYSLDLHNLPLDRLQLEDQKRLHQRLRVKTSGAEDRIPTTRMSSFSIINIQPPVAARRGVQTHIGVGGSHTPPARMPKHYTTTPDLSLRKMKNLPKANTIDAGIDNPPAPDEVKYGKRHSVPAQHADSSPSLPPVPETIAEVGDPDSHPPGRSPQVTRTPKRSTSSVADYYRNKEEEDVADVTPSDVNPSPGAQSLPPEAVFRIEMSEPSGEVGISTTHEGLDEIKEITGNEVFVNPNTLSPSPEPEEKSFDGLQSEQKDVKSAKSAIMKRTPEHLSSENEKQVKHKESVSSFKKYRFRWQSRTTDHQPLRTKQQKGKLDVAPNDLVLRNENSRDSLTLTGEELDKLKRGPTRSDSDSSDLHSKSEPLSLTKSVSVSSPMALEPRTPRFNLLHKSSSEGSLPNLIVNVELKDSSSGYTPPPQFKKSDQHLLLRRVISSGGGSPSNTATREVCVPDPFSSDIIPNSREGVITPPAQSPARPSFKQGRPLKKAVSIAHEGYSMESQVDEPLETLVEQRGSGTKSPPALVVRLTSPTPPLSPPGTQHSHGWDPVISASVWLRMLRILGNINEIKSPYIHAEAMACLQGIWKALVDISDNSGISLSSQKTPPLPDYMPPLSILTNWVIKACSLPPEYSAGRMRAYQLLCEIFIRHWHTQASQDHLVHFHSLLHEALQPSSAMLHVAVRCSCKLFSHGLPGSTILLSDCVQACSKILSTQSGGPRNEALILLGSLLYLPDLYSDVVLPTLDDQEAAGPGVKGEELKEKLVDILFHAAVKEPTRISRCIALYQIGILAYSELCSGHLCRRLPDGIDILLANLQFADRGVAMCAIDMISLLCEVATQMQQLYPSMPTRVVEALCYAIAVFLTDELEKVAWVDKVIVTLIHCLRDWVMVLSPCEPSAEGCLDEHTIKSVFEVLQAAAGSKHHAISQLFTIRNPTNIELQQLETSNSRSPRGQLARSSQISSHKKKSVVDVQLSSEQLAMSGSGAVADGDRIQTAARSILTHLLNLFGHFPFGCGAAQMTSNIMEYHDCPSLQHMDELSAEIFDSPRLQFFSFSDRAVVTFVEIPAKFDDVPSKAKTGNFQTRLIVRDVTGKYTWDCAVLYGQEPTTTQSDYPTLLSKASSMDSLSESLETAPESLPIPDAGPPSSGDPLQPPFWREYLNSDRDVLEDLLKHIETTSPECVLYPEQVGLCEPVPVKCGGVMDEEGVGAVEGGMVRLLMQQDFNEKQYIKEAFSQSRMQGEKASAPRHFPNILAFHHCRVFLSHLGMFSWNKRSHLDLLEKNNQLILELKHLDSIQAQCRQTYKVAVLYVAPGQEDKTSILLNSRGSKEYEEFVAGLGWEVDMQTHSGYMGGLKREFCANCTLPYYATSSEEVLFHVSTRLPSKVEQKVRHLGNDEVHIVWSEHWRDYRRTIFKTQFADVLIIIYPLPNGLFRIQINKKPNVPQFGPLFDGALINRDTLSPLVRATALNALRAQRTPLIGYRGRYEERLKYIQSIISKKLMSSFEHFAENVMHPLETSNTQSAPSMPTVTSLRSSPMKPPTSLSSSSLPSFISTHAHSHTSSAATTVTSSHHHSSVRPHLPHLPDTPPKLVAAFLRLPSRALESARGSTPSPPMRPRSNTNDESMLKPPKSPSMSRNSSVPDNLSELGRSRSNTNCNNSISPIAITRVTDQSNNSASHTVISSSTTL